MKRPDVSIVLLTWNRAPMLEKCLRGLFKSLSRDLSHEVLLMDNASTDRTPAILDSYKNYREVKIIYNKKNLRLNAYKKLFAMARGRLIIEVDDDILEFPPDFDKTFAEYFKAYPDYGYLALNVVQNDWTDGAKPGPSCYKADVRGEKIVEEGPVGGWCAAFHGRHYRPFIPIIHFLNFSMARVEDGFLSGLIGKIWRKRLGIIRNAVCLHATGPEYAKEFNLLNREHEKYMVADMPEFAKRFKQEHDEISG